MNDFAKNYLDDGFVFPVNIMSSSDMKELLEDFENAENELRNDSERSAILHSYPDRLLPTFDRLIRHPTIIELVSQVLGPDLHVWSAGVFDKKAQSEKIVSWHQDLTYWGLDDAEEMTVWVAITPATEDSGCMKFVAGSHKQKQVAHVDTFSENNLLSRGQEIAVDVNEEDSIPVVLQPGQASFHHGHLFHASGPNTTTDRRLGIAIRYIKTSMQQQTREKSLVALVNGTDKHGHFTIANGPIKRLNESDFDLCRADIALKRKILYAGAEDKKGTRY